MDSFSADEEIKERWGGMRTIGRTKGQEELPNQVC